MMIKMEKKTDIEGVSLGLKGEVRFNEPMSRHTSLGIGGPADLLVLPQDEEDLAMLLSRTHEEGIPIMFLGAGSNLLVKDGGIRGVVVKLSNFRRTWFERSGIWAEAGVPLPTLLKQGLNFEAEGFEALYGIPGTVGGAVIMNAGTREGDTASLIREIRFLTLKGEMIQFKREDLEFHYRSCRLPRGVVLEALFKVHRGNRKKIMEKLQRYRERRNATQPLNLPNVGSIFKNPDGYSSGQLIDSVGLKGHRIGGAQISNKHGNFFVNRGMATARDVISLMKLAGKRVQQEKGIVLELEVRIIGREER